MYEAGTIARYVINWCHEQKIKITNLKLQKLLYFLQGNYYQCTGKKLIQEDFHAWQLGPVIPKVYIDYSIYSSGIIPPKSNVGRIDQDSMELMNTILAYYAFLPTWELVEISHNEDPWKYTFSIFGNKAKISFQTIADYYEGKNGRK